MDTMIARVIKQTFAKAKQLGLLETCQHATRTGIDAYSKPTFAISTPFEAVWDQTRRYIRTTDGEQAVARGSLILEGAPTINPEDQVTLPDSTIPIILDVQRGRVGGAVSVQQVFF